MISQKHSKKGHRCRIGLDARFYGPAQKGIGRYEQELVDRLTAGNPDLDFVVFLGRHNFDEFIPRTPNVQKVLADVRWYTIKEQFVMPYLVRRHRVDLTHYLHFNVSVFSPRPFVVTIHDLILTKHVTQRASTLSPWLYRFKNLAYRIAIGRAARRSERIITISNYCRNDIIREFGVPANKVTLTYEGVAESLKATPRDNDKKVLLGYNIDSEYLLYVGNAYPHKNLEAIVDIWPKIKEKYPKLKFVFVGKKDYFYKQLKERVEKNGLGADMIFAGFVADRELATFYSCARAYVFPSLFEGFGLPPLEAMAHGCPVAASNMTCLPEVLGPAALYFDPRDQEQMLLTIQKILDDRDLRAKLVQAGYDQVRRYSWDDCAKRTAELYRDLLSLKCRSQNGK